MSRMASSKNRSAEDARAQAPAASVRTPRPAPEPIYEGDFVLGEPLALDCGQTLPNPTLHYAVYGRLDAARSNAVLVCHALSGSALVGSWWPELFAPEIEDRLVDTRRDCIVCINLLGSCYGSTGPSSVDPRTGRVYGPDFPLLSIRDNVRAQVRLLDSLGIHRLRLAIGGMQALQWSIDFPDRVERAVVIGVAPLGAMGLALNHTQRMAIVNDPDWKGGNYLTHRQPRRGLSLARQIATFSYKSPELFEERFARRPNRNGEQPWLHQPGANGLLGGRYDIAGYLDYQGAKFPDRFDANSYLAILRMMDNWDPLRDAGTPEAAFAAIRARLLLVGISSDLLFPARDVQKLTEIMQSVGVHADYREMITAHGHDAFLAEQVELVRLLHSLD